MNVFVSVYKYVNDGDIDHSMHSVYNLILFASIDEFTAIINPPQVGILAVGSASEQVQRHLNLSYSRVKDYFLISDLSQHWRREERHEGHAILRPAVSSDCISPIFHHHSTGIGSVVDSLVR